MTSNSSRMKFVDFVEERCYFPLDYWSAVIADVKRVLKPGGQFVFDFLGPRVASGAGLGGSGNLLAFEKDIVQ